MVNYVLLLITLVFGYASCLVAAPLTDDPGRLFKSQGPWRTNFTQPLDSVLIQTFECDARPLDSLFYTDFIRHYGTYKGKGPGGQPVYEAEIMRVSTHPAQSWTTRITIEYTVWPGHIWYQSARWITLARDQPARRGPCTVRK